MDSQQQRLPLVVVNGMGRASRARSAIRTQRAAANGLLIRMPRPADEPALLELLRQVEFTNPEVAEEVARAAARDERLDPSCGVRAAWVAERRRDEVVGVLHAAPPLRWIVGIEGVSREHRSRVAHRVVELEALSVSLPVRGQRLGYRLIERACAHYRGLGYRLALGTFTTSTLHLVPYYQQAGFTVRGPGESIAVLDPMGMALHRPADPHVIQMWKPLHPDIATMLTTMPDGSQVEVITGALEAPDGVPEKVVHHNDGSVTLSGGGRRLTVPAQHVEKLTLMAQTEVTVDEVKAIAAEAELHGMEPLFAAKLCKASGYSLAELRGVDGRSEH
ncbi:GNAT family N-acetyltransferase [Kitasatospora sp. NPDC059088]|uniref:GNAT family N-acetyltransferase n=1 Tax=Kitasatospora sp. NPDC059088 TaxID=3346722 RepID=UPI003674DD62